MAGNHHTVFSQYELQVEGAFFYLEEKDVEKLACLGGNAAVEKIASGESCDDLVNFLDLEGDGKKAQFEHCLGCEDNVPGSCEIVDLSQNTGGQFGHGQEKVPPYD
jgi:hypothetical protein